MVIPISMSNISSSRLKMIHYSLSPGSHRPRGSSPVSNPEEMMIPANSVSFTSDAKSHNESDEDSCMDLCSSSSCSDDSVSIVTKVPPMNIEFTDSSSGQKPLKRPRHRKLFDQVDHADRNESYDRRPMHTAMLLKSVSKHTSDIADDTDWEEFGVFSSTYNKFEAMPLTNVRLAFSPSELSFFTDMELYNVGDLIGANTNVLSINLLESANFRKACAFYAWKDKKPLRNYLSLRVALNTVIKWKKTLAQQSSKDDAKNEPVNKRKDAPAENTEKENNDVPLASLLSIEETLILRDHYSIETATQLINASPYMIQTLSGIMAPQFDGRTSQEIKCICEGMLYSWVLRSREAIEKAESASTKTETESSCATISEKRALIETPLSYVDFLFFEQEGISSDQELSSIDPSLLTRQYAAFLHTKGMVLSHVNANKKLKRLRQEASLVRNGLSNVANASQDTRLNLAKLPKGVMLSVNNLCKTTIDTNNNGLPKKTLIVYDDLNKVLYEFSVSIHDSSIPNSGKGAFLTFK